MNCSRRFFSIISVSPVVCPRVGHLAAMSFRHWALTKGWSAGPKTPTVQDSLPEQTGRSGETLVSCCWERTTCSSPVRRRRSPRVHFSFSNWQTLPVASNASRKPGGSPSRVIHWSVMGDCAGELEGHRSQVSDWDINSLRHADLMSLFRCHCSSFTAMRVPVGQKTTTTVCQFTSCLFQTQVHSVSADLEVLDPDYCCLSCHMLACCSQVLLPELLSHLSSAAEPNHTPPSQRSIRW